MSKHQKHPSLLRSTVGKYHRSEWAIYGSDCNIISKLYNEIHNELSDQFELVFIDADHNNDSKQTLFQTVEKQLQYHSGLIWNDYDDRLLNWPVDCVFVNGNHYPAKRQIVIIDTRKKESLRRRLDYLTQIDIILLKNSDDDIYDFLSEKYKTSTPIFNIGQIKEIADWLKVEVEKSIPKLNALILAGGQSKRMSEDKSKIQYNGDISQVRFLADITESIGLKTFVSRSYTEENEIYEGIPVIKDKITGMGPFGAIISSFIHNPNVAYLVLACDLPFINKDSLIKLIEARVASKFATSYQLQNQEFPEPLLSIYEPKIYQRMMRFLTLGYACPRKVLINSDIQKVILKDDKIAFNANTPSERDYAKNQLN